MTRNEQVASQPKNETGQRGNSNDDEPEPNKNENYFVEQVHRKDALDGVPVYVP